MCHVFFRRPMLFWALFCKMNIWPRQLELKKETKQVAISRPKKHLVTPICTELH